MYNTLQMAGQVIRELQPCSIILSHQRRAHHWRQHCLLRRMVCPPQQYVIGTLCHPREFVYWPGMNGSIKNLHQQVKSLQRAAKYKSRKEIIDVTWPARQTVGQSGSRTFPARQERVSCHCGLLVKLFWDWWIITDTSVLRVVKCLCHHFATQQIPDSVITDNRPQFTSDTFA